MENHYKNRSDNSNYSGLLIVYAVSIGIAFSLIFPTEEVWYNGLLKATIWPLYLITKIA